MTSFWNTIFYAPLYNALVFLVGFFGGHIGIAVIVLTLLVKIILSPLSYRSIVSQIKQKKLQPMVDELKKKFPKQEEQAKKIFELYKEHKANPFSGCVLILLQIPVIIALYQVFLKGVGGETGLLYSFLSIPETLNPMFLGMDLGEKSIILALLAGGTQFLQMKFSPAMKTTPKVTTEIVQEEKPSFQKEVMENMQKQMKFTMPIMIAVFGYLVPGAIALYWIVTNIYTIGQEFAISRRMDREAKELN